MLNKNINYKLVDTAGQITAVVFNVQNRKEYPPVSNYLMGFDSRIEQVVFVEKGRIQTMGNELCINGSLAGAFLLKQSKFNISGISPSVVFVQKDGEISIKIPINILQIKDTNIIKLTGIVYKISNNKRVGNKAYLKRLANKYSVPASGMIFYEQNRIQPLVYVKKTDSLVWENACGSGSLSYFIYSGINEVVQPSNKTIEIYKIGKYFTIKLQAKIVE
jgi:hypothetical protein